MGCSGSSAACDADEQPYHWVELDAYRITTTEITQAQYQACIAGGSCSEPYTGGVCEWDPAFQPNHPVNCVTWQKAADYCTWLGGGLPTEAQWEKAARGSSQSKYPWGNADPDCTLANFDEDVCPGGLADVGSHPAGASPYGVHDMAGNVGEWVADYFSPSYYASSPGPNPTGPTTPPPGFGERVHRGGFFEKNPGWEMGGAWELPTVYERFFAYPTYNDAHLGFRCALPPS
jgi:formylglycine-generating enzyme required for sulfatase activity